MVVESSSAPGHGSAAPIAITGCGWITPFAAGSLNDVLAAAMTAERPAAGDLAWWPVPESLLEPAPANVDELRRDKGAWMTAVAVGHAMTDAGLLPEAVAGERLGLVLGAALAGQPGMIQFAEEVRAQSARFVSPINFPQTVGNYMAGAVARAFGVRGPNLTLASGLCSSLDAVREAADLLATGRADVILAGGTEPLNDSLARLATLLAITRDTDSATPPGASPTPVLPAEGACWFVLEPLSRAMQRGARPLALIDTQRVDPSESDVEDRLMSSFAVDRTGAIRIENCIGFCPAAGGAAALAAALGALHHLPVPRWAETCARPDSAKEALILAPAPCGPPRALRLTLS